VNHLHFLSLSWLGSLLGWGSGGLGMGREMRRGQREKEGEGGRRRVAKKRRSKRFGNDGGGNEEMKEGWNGMEGRR